MTQADRDGAGGGAVLSVVIPAHNEEQVIGRCLSTLLADTNPGEFEVVVVTNGCTDRTAEIATSFGDVVVVESPMASKPAALNLGDETARRFPRLYIDADVEVTTAAARAVGALLESAEVELAAPELRFDMAGRPWAVRAWYDIWQRLPYGAEDHVGTGFYGLSARGRGRFGAFPDTMAEDFYVWAQIPRQLRKVAAGHQFVVHPPLTFRSLLRIQTRMQAATARNRTLFADAAHTVGHRHRRELLDLARRPGLAPKVVLYIGSQVWAKLAARRKNRSAAPPTWDRDDTARSRTPAGAAEARR
jgi:glycosyltransferase involved in cell wall biosynthesis